MPKFHYSSRTGPGSGWPRRNRAGSSALSVLAGAALMCAGTTAAALAAAHSAGAAAPPVCQPLPVSQSARPGPVHRPRPPFRLARRALRELDRALAAAPSTSPTLAPVELCVSVQAVTVTAQPGQPAAYRIRVWPSGGTIGGVFVQLSDSTGRSSPPFRAPAFSYCGAGDGTATCAVGTLQESQASELQAQVEVPAAAPAGDTVTLTAIVTGTAGGMTGNGTVTAAATVSIVAAPTTSTRPVPRHSSPGHGKPRRSSSPARPGTGLRPGSLPSLSAPRTSAGSIGSVTARNPSIAFPEISPAPSAAPSSPARSVVKPVRGPYRASAAADVLPLNGGQLGGQVAGLIVLILGIALVIVRVSLRRPG